MRFDVVTLFPEIFDSITKCGITARAMKRGLWSCHTWNPRAMTEDVHRTVDATHNDDGYHWRTTPVSNRFPKP